MCSGRRSIAEMVGTFVSVGLWLGGRFPGRDVPAYIAAQVAGALLAGGVLYAIASGAPGFSLLVIMGVTDPKRAPAGFGPLAIGLALTLIHLISIPVTNTSVNPARTTGVGGLLYRALAEPRPLALPERQQLGA